MYIAFLSVCMSLPVFAKKTDNLFFVKKGTKVSGLNKVTLKLDNSVKISSYNQKGVKSVGFKNVRNHSLKSNQAVFYLKEKTVFHEEKNINVKIVYISNTLKVQKDEKVITSYKKPKLQFHQHIHTQLKPFHKIPFNVGFLGFSRSKAVFVLPNVFQNVKIVNVFNTFKKVGDLYLKENYKIFTLVKNRNFIHKTSKYTKSVFNTTFGRPPPFFVDC